MLMRAKSQSTAAHPGEIRSVVRYVNWFLRFRMTAEGKYVLAGWAIATSLGAVDLSLPVYLLVCAWSAMGVLAFCVGWLMRPSVAIHGRFPAKARAGQSFTTVVHLVNQRRRAAYDIGLGFFGLRPSLKQIDENVIVDRLAPAESTGGGHERELALSILPLRRGFYPMPLMRAYSSFPFGLFRTPAGDTPWPSLLVLPAFEPVGSIDIPLGTRYQPGGIALTSNIGESPEYIGNREYRAGDSPRHIDYRSWARLATPVVREFQEEYYHRIALLVDTYVPGRRRPGPEGFPALEAAVSLSAAVADALSRGEYILDIFAAGPELYVFRSGRHTAHFENVLEILACVEACRKDPFMTVAPALAEELNNISAVICVLLDFDTSREGLVRTAAEAGCSLKLLIVRDGPTTLPIERAYAWTPDVVCLTPDAVRAGGLEAL